MIKLLAPIIIYIAIIFLPTQLFSNKDGYKLSPEVLKNKKIGWYMTPLPIIIYNTDNGIGYGLRMMVFNNGDKDDSYFEYTPFFYKLTAQFFQTTLGWQYHFIEADMPYFLKTKFRIKCRLVYERLLNANYFGYGSSASTLTNPNTGETYNSYENYFNNFLNDNKNNPLNYKFNKYTINRPHFNLDIYYNINKFFKSLIGVEIKWTEVLSWKGKKFDTDDTKNVVSGPTFIDLDPRLGRFDQDGWLNSIKFGIAFDTRDYEPDPKNGFLIDGTLKLAHSLLESEVIYRRFAFNSRAFFTPIKNLTLAARLGYITSSGNIPFHELGVVSFFYNNKDTLGNNRTLRGYPMHRFIGNTMTLASLELRYDIYELTPGSQRFKIKPIAFIETGRAFDHGSDPYKTIRNYKVGYGGGLVIAWNQATIIHLYWGFSREDKTFSLDVGHAIE